MKNLRKTKIILLSIALIVIGLYLVENITYQNKIQYESRLVETYFQKEETPKIIPNNDYIGILEIPKINLKRGYYEKGDSRNNIDSNITLIDHVDNKDYIFAAHSGNDKIAYFNDIHLLEKGDTINLYQHNAKVSYIIYNKYLDNKNGKVSINKSTKQRIILITCNNNDSNNYLVIEAYIK